MLMPPAALPRACALILLATAITIRPAPLLAQNYCPGAALGYFNMTTYTQQEYTLLEPTLNDGPEIGNRVTLAGRAPSVHFLAVRIRLYGDGVAQYDVVARLYANDGPGGAPGTLLWTSSPVRSVADSGYPVGSGFTVPDVPVPNAVTYTIQVSNRTGVSGLLGASEFTPPTVGSAAPGIWKRIGPGPTDWILTAFGDFPIGAYICVISAPADPNCDGAADGLDVAAFVQAIIDPSAYASQYPGCDMRRADMNCDGVVNAADVSGFVACLISGACSCP